MKAKTTSTFDPGAAASADSGIFGLPYTFDESQLILIPVPWEATTSYRTGTAQGPEAILEASKQVDLFDLEVERPYTPGIYFEEISESLIQKNTQARELADPIIEAGGDIGGDTELARKLDQVNALSREINSWVKTQTQRVLTAKKIPAIVGGDHSVPLGAFQAMAESVGEFGILHFDAHSDTRVGYEGFTYSHASIMYNALQEVPQIKKLVQVGIRDFSEDEVNYCASQGSRVKIYFDTHLRRRMQDGNPWNTIAQEIVTNLPRNVWVSFDIDGLDPKLCPNTGTPVPGGLEFLEANAILRALVQSGRKIIGFDLNEVAPDPTGSSEWDANVGARLLYKLCAWTFASQKICNVRD